MATHSKNESHQTRKAIYIDGDPDWNKPRLALLITGILAVIFAARAVAAIDSPFQLGFYFVLICLVLLVGVYVRHKYVHSRIEVDDTGIEVAVSIFRRRNFNWQDIRNVYQENTSLKIELTNGEVYEADLAYFTPEALGRIRSALRK